MDTENIDSKVNKVFSLPVGDILCGHSSGFRHVRTGGNIIGGDHHYTYYVMKCIDCGQNIHFPTSDIPDETLEEIEKVAALKRKLKGVLNV
jgi:hypothetical protein